MQYYKGGTLSSVLQTNKMMKTWQLCVNTCLSIAGALYSIHKEGMLHRDLHSGNLLNIKGKTPHKDNDEVTYIADFGMSVAADSVAAGD